MKTKNTEHGAAAVEFALVVPMLMVIVFAIIVFGQVFTMQIALTQAARTAARSMAVSDSATESNPQTTAINMANANTMGGATFSYAFSQPACVPDSAITVTVDTSVTGLGLLPPFNLSGVGSMQCGG